MKTLLSLSNSISFSCSPLIKTVKKMLKLYYFRLETRLFGIWGSCRKNGIFQNRSSFFLRFFWHQTYIATTPPTVFFLLFSPLFSPQIWKRDYFFQIFGSFDIIIEYLFLFCWKLVENWFIKVDHFKPCFPNFRIVHWLPWLLIIHQSF